MFGDAIDQDHKPSIIVEESHHPGIYTMAEIDWDVNLSDNPTIEEMIDCLASDQRLIYRASISLGIPIDDVLEPITRVDSPENEIDFTPNSLSIAVGPIECFSLGSDPLSVGWISLDLCGDGYLFPWTLRDVFERISASSVIRRLTDVCRSFWPVPAELPSPELVELRRQFHEVWPYDQFDKSLDWYWGLQETG